MSKRTLVAREEQQRKLADAVTQAVMAATGIGEESISVSVEDVAPSDWMAKVYRPDIENGAARLYKRPGYGPLAGKGEALRSRADSSPHAAKLGLPLSGSLAGAAAAAAAASSSTIRRLAVRNDEGRQPIELLAGGLRAGPQLNLTTKETLLTPR